MVLSHFFGVPLPSKVVDEPRFTVLQIPKESESGIYFDNVVLERELSSTSGLRYDDFSILKLLKAGIKPSYVHCQNDIRLGSDKDIEAFNVHVDELAEQLFND